MQSTAKVSFSKSYKARNCSEGCCPQAQSACSLETRWKNSWQHTKVKPSEAECELWAESTAWNLRKATFVSPDPTSQRKKQTLAAGWDAVKHPSLSETHLPAEVKPFFSVGGNHLPEYSKAKFLHPRFLTFLSSFRLRSTSQRHHVTFCTAVS